MTYVVFVVAWIVTRLALRAVSDRPWPVLRAAVPLAVALLVSAMVP